MITGIGTDVVSIPRIEKVLERFGDRFVNRIRGLSRLAAQPSQGPGLVQAA